MPESTKRLLIACLLLALLLSVAGYVGLRFIRFLGGETEEHLRARLNQGGQLEKLKMWASDRLAKQLWAGAPDEMAAIDAARLGISDVYVERDKLNKVMQIVVEFGGGDHHHGLIIGPAGFAPAKSPWYVNRWCDVVWYYDEFKPRP
jgi:hypothetical protein